MKYLVFLFLFGLYSSPSFALKTADCTLLGNNCSLSSNRGIVGACSSADLIDNARAMDNAAAQLRREFPRNARLQNRLNQVAQLQNPEDRVQAYMAIAGLNSRQEIAEFAVASDYTNQIQNVARELAIPRTTAERVVVELRRPFDRQQ